MRWLTNISTSKKHLNVKIASIDVNINRPLTVIKTKLKIFPFSFLFTSKAEHSKTGGYIVCQLQDHSDHPLEKEPERGARL